MTESTGNAIWSERWRLAALSKDELVRLGLASLIMSLAFVLFHLLGNTTEVRVFGRSALVWMVGRWKESGGDLSHGYLIPFVSAGIMSPFGTPGRAFRPRSRDGCSGPRRLPPAV